jgi:hypothetical protein
MMGSAAVRRLLGGRSASPPSRRRSPRPGRLTPGRGLAPPVRTGPSPRPSCQCVLRCLPLPDGPARRYSPGAGMDGRREARGPAEADREKVVSTSEVPANPSQDGGSNSAAAGLAGTRRPAPSGSRFILVVGNAWFDHDQPGGDLIDSARVRPPGRQVCRLRTEARRAEVRAGWGCYGHRSFPGESLKGSNAVCARHQLGSRASGLRS